MKKSLITAIILLTGFLQCMAFGFQNERLHYVISYKWGLIHKDAGNATLTLRHNGNNYDLMLAAKTKPWADKFYRVRDTLLCTVRQHDLRPISYSKITHEKNTDSRDEIKYSNYKSVTKGETLRYRFRDGKWNVTKKQLTASGPVFDMLSIFYYLRSLNYEALHNNQVFKATVFSGSKAETITIRCLGKKSIKLKNKTSREAYHIRFNFTQEGGRKSSDDIDTWISADSRHIPLYLVGKLPVGEVRAYFIN